MTGYCIRRYNKVVRTSVTPVHSGRNEIQFDRDTCPTASNILFNKDPRHSNYANNIGLC